MENRNKAFSLPFDTAYNIKVHNLTYNWSESDGSNQIAPFHFTIACTENLIFDQLPQSQPEESAFQHSGQQNFSHSENPYAANTNMLGEISFIKYDENESYKKDLLDDSPLMYGDAQNASDNMTRKDSEYTYVSNTETSENQAKPRMDMEIEYENASNDTYSQGTSERSNSLISLTFSEPKAKVEYEIKMEFEAESVSVAAAHNDAHFFQQLETKLTTNLGKLREMIDRVLRGNDIKKSELDELNDFEKAIVICVNQKKSKSEGIRASKRREEKQKLFFKSALKHIENNYLVTVLKCRSTLRKKESDVNLFYKEFFAEVAQEKRLDLSTFYPPCQRRKYRPEGVHCMKNELKSFNLRYIELILSSKKFREETIDFLENEFSQSYSKSRLKKIDKLLENAMNVLSQNFKQSLLSYSARSTDMIQQAIGKLQDLILNNPKSKLPWSNAELEETKHFARETIEKVSLNLLNHE